MHDRKRWNHSCKFFLHLCVSKWELNTSYHTSHRIDQRSFSRWVPCCRFVNCCHLLFLLKWHLCVAYICRKWMVPCHFIACYCECRETVNKAVGCSLNRNDHKLSIKTRPVVLLLLWFVSTENLQITNNSLINRINLNPKTAFFMSVITTLNENDITLESISLGYT